MENDRLVSWRTVYSIANPDFAVFSKVHGSDESEGSEEQIDDNNKGGQSDFDDGQGESSLLGRLNSEHVVETSSLLAANQGLMVCEL